MANSDLAIGAAGSSAWERCCLGLPSIVLSYAENQKFLAESLGKSGVHWYVGRLNDISEMDLMSVVNHANASSSSLFYLSNNASNVCDGRGVVRVVRMLINFELELRPASHDDVGMLFSWRNDPAIRKYFFNSGEISIEEHSAWFENSLKMSDRILLVASSKKNPVGCLRFDFHDKAAEVSIYLNPTAVGKGLGTGILEYGTRWLKKNHPEIETINALVLRNNMASQKVFSDAGYDLNYLSYSKQLH
jgi:RimJ/RimL family protein N-acetyltransferase